MLTKEKRRLLISRAYYAWAQIQSFFMATHLNANDIASIIAGTIVVAAEVIGLVLDREASIFVLVVAVAAILISLLRITFAFLQNRNCYRIHRDDAYRQSVLDRLVLSKFQCGLQKEHYVESDEVNRRLFNGSLSRRGAIGLHALAGAFQVPNELRPMVFSILSRLFDRHKDQRLFNGKLLRMAEDLFPKAMGNDSVAVQMSRYFDGQVTNEVVFQRIEKLDSVNECFEGSALLVDSNGVLLRFWQSRRANFMGASTIAMTSDGVLILGYQGAQSMANRSRYAPRDLARSTTATIKSSRQKALTPLCRRWSSTPRRESFVKSAPLRHVADCIRWLLATLAYLKEAESLFCLTFMDMTWEEVERSFRGNLSLREMGLVAAVEGVRVSVGQRISEALEKRIEGLQRSGGKVSIRLRLCADQLKAVEELPEGREWIERHQGKAGDDGAAIGPVVES